MHLCFTMTNSSQPSLVPQSPLDHVFPTLTNSHLERMARLGQKRAVRRDDVLVTETGCEAAEDGLIITV